MKILSISTATNYLSVALNQNEKVIQEANEKDPRNHSEKLDPTIAQLLHQEYWRLRDIDRFAVVIGPGSYTGLRIGVTTAKMFAAILPGGLVAIPTLQALAANFSETDALLVAGLDARNDNFFAGGYINQEGRPVNVLKDGHYHITELIDKVKVAAHQPGLQRIIFAGTGFAKQAKHLDELAMPWQLATEDENRIHAGQIGRLAVTAQPVDPDQLVPHYLRRTQAEMDWHKRTGKPFGPDSAYVEEV